MRGIAGMGMQALKLYYDTEESREGVRACKEKRKPDFRKYRQVASGERAGAWRASTSGGSHEPLSRRRPGGARRPARRFATERIAPGFQERDRTRVLDRGADARDGRDGLHRARPARAHSAARALGCLAAGVIHEEVARADLSMSYVNLLASLNGQILSATRPARGGAALAAAARRAARRCWRSR